MPRFDAGMGCTILISRSRNKGSAIEKERRVKIKKTVEIYCICECVCRGASSIDCHVLLREFGEQGYLQQHCLP